ncbi:MAG: winged helix-turn-helix transcriptional regulator, partial [Candidatus Hadarchaeum sp.]
HDMTVRDVEIVGYIMERGEFTIPELMRLSNASKITVWRTVRRLVQKGLVVQTDKTRLSSNGLGGRGKPSRIYRYVGKAGSDNKLMSGSKSIS